MKLRGWRLGKRMGLGKKKKKTEPMPKWRKEKVERQRRNRYPRTESKGPSHPSNNWILKCITRSRFFYGIDAPKKVIYDNVCNNTLVKVLKSVDQPGVSTVPGPDCSIPLFQIAGLALGYRLRDTSDLYDVVLAFTKDRSIRSFLNEIKVHTKGNAPMATYFPVAFMNNRLKKIEKMMKQRGALPHPCVVFSDTLNPTAIGQLKKNGYFPKMFLLDGRTLGPVQFDNIRKLIQRYPESKFILLSPSKYLHVPGFPVSKPVREGLGKPMNPNGGIPLLVHKKMGKFTLSPIPVTYDFGDCFSYLDDLKKLGDRVPYEFRSLAWSLFRLLMSLPIKPSNLNRAWSKTSGYLEHPIAAPLARLENIVQRAQEDDNEAVPYLENCVHALSTLKEKLDHDNPKENQIINLLDQQDGNVIVVSNRTVAKAIENTLGNKYPDLAVKNWYDPPIWSPTDERVIICSPPSPGREWITTVRLSDNVIFLFYPIEAALMCHRYKKIDLDKGRGWSILTEMTKAVPESTEMEVLIEDDDPYSIIKGLADTPATIIRMKTKTPPEERDKQVRVVPIILQECGIYWARPQSRIAVIRGGRQYRLPPGDLKEKDLAILPRHSPGSDIIEAVFDAVESKPGNRGIVTVVREWKASLVKYRDEHQMPDWEIAQKLNELKANVHTYQITNILGNWLGEEKQIATWDSEPLIRATFKLLGRSYREKDVEALMMAITRLRGIHQKAGKMLKRIAESSISYSDTELSQIVESELGLTLDDLDKQIMIRVVEDVHDPQEVPGHLAGSIEITHEEVE